MSRRFVALLAVACLGVMAAECGDDPPPGAVNIMPTQPISVMVAPSTVTLMVGLTRQLTATVTGTSNAAVTWSSSNANVAAVTAEGLVRGVSPGMTTVVAASVVDPNIRGAATVTVGAGEL